MQRVLLHRRQHARRRQDPQVGDAAGPGGKSGIDLPNEQRGLVPSTEWKRRARAKSGIAGETISVAIGQGAGVGDAGLDGGDDTATLANGGTRVTPHCLKAVDEGNGWEPVPAPPPHSKVAFKPEKLQAHSRRHVDGRQCGRHGRPRARSRDTTWPARRDGAGHFERGTARGARPTGKDLRDHGWFVFFAPRDNPEIAGVVFVEHGDARLSRRPIAQARRSRRSSRRRKASRCRSLPPKPPPDADRAAGLLRFVRRRCRRVTRRPDATAAGPRR